MVTSHSEKFFHIWNLDNIFKGGFDPVKVIKSNLTNATSAISCFSNGKGFAVGSIEGRVSINYIPNFDKINLDMRESTPNYTFKCHRAEDSYRNAENVYTINSISFNKTFDTFATAGSDGLWMTWNYETKSRYKLCNGSGRPVTSVAFSQDAILLVAA